jgi:putative phosphoribosyl transferase
MDDRRFRNRAEAGGFREVLDEIVCAAMPRPFYAVGLWYDDFSQTSDEEVRGLLEQAADVRPIRARSVR